jgi:hypothetical protein
VLLDIISTEHLYNVLIIHGPDAHLHVTVSISPIFSFCDFQSDNENATGLVICGAHLYILGSTI